MMCEMVMARREMIEIFPWDRRYDTGIEAIDRQHRKLVDLLNRLANAVALPSSEAKETVESVLSELRAYTVYHFETEEKIWHQYFEGEPQERKHRRTHRGFVEKLEAIEAEKETLEKREAVLSLMRFLARWLAEHILVTDRQMAMEVQAIEAGKDRERAKEDAEKRMEGEKQVLIDIVLSTLESHVSNTIALIDEIIKERALLAHLRIYAEAFSHMREGMIVIDASGRVVEINDAFTRLTGYTFEEVKGRKIVRLFGTQMQTADFYEKAWSDLVRNGTWEGEVWQQRKDGDIFPAWFTATAIRSDPSLPAPDRYVIIFSNISVMKEHEKELAFIAHHDPLTGLPNRLLLSDRLKLAMVQAERRKEKLAVVYIDLDGFKEINDRYGHEAGDQLLVEVAKNLRHTLREGDTLARIGGDEFVAILNDVKADAEDTRLFKRLLSAASKPVVVDGEPLHVSASIGVVFYPDERENVDADQLIRDADRAMYEAKESGKNRFCIFDAKGVGRSSARPMKDQLKEAIQKGELELYYQPIVELRKGEVVGAEGLLRWRHPDRGTLLPVEFLPSVEHDPWMAELELWVVAAALAQSKQWMREGFVISVNVNLTAETLLSPSFLTSLDRALAPYPQEAIERLSIEVPESDVFESIDTAVTVLEGCAKRDIRVVLDDFGSGSLLLGQIDMLPAVCFKADKSILMGAATRYRNLAVLEGIKAISDAFMRRFVGVGVASELHGRLLLKLGCLYGQGHAIAPPMEASALKRWADQWSPPELWRATKPLSKKGIPFLLAEVAHREWLHQISMVLEGTSVELPPLDERSCRFGQWLEKENGSLVDLESLERLKRIHHEVHELGEKAVAIWRMGTEEETRHFLTLLGEKSEELLGILQQMEEQNVAN
jgi:diguanylate cyclase (GGDEF)-like protein/hemerythrin-like metal-binding protein/PAS domain S-box-containing protein